AKSIATRVIMFTWSLRFICMRLQSHTGSFEAVFKPVGPFHCPRIGDEVDTIDWDVVVRRDGPKLYRYFRARFSHGEAADLVQEVLLRVFRKEEDGGFDVQKGSFLAYAMGVAHFVAREAVRKTIRLREDLVGETAGWDGLRSVD